MRTAWSLFLLSGITLLLIASANPQHQQPTKKNKEIAIFFMTEVLGNDKLHMYKSLHTNDFTGHSGGQTFSLEEDYQAAVDNKKGIPDLSFNVTHSIAENDMVVVQWIATGTHLGTNTFLPEPTGKKLQVHGMTIFRMKGGKIAEEWGLTDLLSVLIKNNLYPLK